ncbi:ExoV-like protein [Synechococcus sp. PCC 7335]|uniref:polysaccharide pyruvyl transferase family protein n=1 Tax=Synechococcus sp. (strain ATCC 29403 / PCC 7335) TaxID=91464 RepID=UPI00017EC6FE|nr:polysaccharide pyruvyl transferase family protein [Synechococcus sp. PCC 7335]EDX85506.1 ExoV-like protein [Synechococcus sp. PCC 7335]
MRLFYYQAHSSVKNFGDELNPWLWSRLLPALNGSDKTLLIGIGTLLNEKTAALVSSAEDVVCFSTGAGYGRSFHFRPPSNWKIYCVRGPLSAKRLNLPMSLAVTDGAALLKRYFKPLEEAERRYEFSYMPHFRHRLSPLFEKVCQRAGIHYIDPTGEIETTISEILQTKVLISEAMHGAVVADTLRVPWIPVRTSPKILLFKWQDWCASVQIPYRYHAIRGARPFSLMDFKYPIRPYLQRQSSIEALLDGFRMSDFSSAFGKSPTEITERKLDSLSTQLVSITRKTPFLSCDRHLETLVVRLEERLEELEKDMANYA